MKVFTAFILSLYCSGTYAQSAGQHLQSNTITTSFPFLLYSPDARSSGLGDVGAALSANANSFHWNTSKLGFSKEAGGISISYTPWLKQLVDDIHLLYLAGYSKFGVNSTHAVGGSIRYLSDANHHSIIGLGAISDAAKSNDIEVLGGYSFRFSDKSAFGVNGKFIFSDALKKANPDSLDVAPAMALAIDLSYGFQSEMFEVGQMKGNWSLGFTASNLGNKTSYSSLSNENFLPANMRIGAAFGLEVKPGHTITSSIDINKLMVPYSTTNTDKLNAFQGVFTSFIDSDDGFVGELREFTFGTGLAYNFNHLLKFRLGYFHEHPTNGNRRFISFGAGVEFKSIAFDASYLASLTQNNPISNTMRFSLSYSFKSRSE